jgi:hypothetical protein
MTTHVFTIAAANYLPKVRVLFRSLRQWQPTWRLHLAIADVPEFPVAPGDVLADEVHELHELGIPNWRPWAFSHTLIELATAIKPFVLRRLLKRPNCSAAIFFDPDIAVFSQLPEITDALAGQDIVLTPHLTSAERTIEGVIANELCTAQHGIYNLGFIGVAARAEGRAFADWWSDRLYHFCREDIASGIYTDQRWIDFVPAFFDRVAILRSSRFNVAPWNLAGRGLAGSLATGFSVGGAPLGFYHFSQVDNDANDNVVAGRAAAAELTGWYRREIADGSRGGAKAPWGLGAFTNGERILPEQRMVYRLRTDLQRTFPDPFAAGPDTYFQWWNRHARSEFPSLFRAGANGDAIRWLRNALVYGRTGAEIAAEFKHDHGRRPWLDEQDADWRRNAAPPTISALLKDGIRLLGLARSHSAPLDNR